MPRSLPSHKFYTAVGFRERPPKNGALIGTKKSMSAARIKTLLYLRAGGFRGTRSAADEGETQTDGGTIFFFHTAFLPSVQGGSNSMSIVLDSLFVPRNWMLYLWLESV